MRENVTTTLILGQALRKARKRQGLSQEDLVGLSGVGRRFISDLENGKETCHIGKVIHVLGSVGIAIQIVTHWEEESNER
ncbi:MAG: helix-turn-helix transcriptional regulator [Alphaproteobacteria bacterium]